MEVLLTAIWPSFARIPNHIPADEGITTAGMIAFLLYFLLQIPFLCIPYTKIQYFFAFKSVIAPIIFLAVFGDTLHKAGGTISHSTVISDGVKIHGSVLAWAFFSSKYTVLFTYIVLCITLTRFTLADLNGVLGNYATLGYVIPPLKKPVL